MDTFRRIYRRRGLQECAAFVQAGFTMFYVHWIPSDEPLSLWVMRLRDCVQ